MTRRYDNSGRRRQAEATRGRIVDAAAELLRETSIRDWDALTIAAVAGRAGVSERTVYRHVGTEQGLRDAVMASLEHEAGVDLDALALDDVAGVATQVLEFVAGYPTGSRKPLDPTLGDADRRRREALLRTVSEQAPAWSERDQATAAAVLDLLWGVDAFEHLLVGWSLERDDALAGIGWVIDLVVDAIGRSDTGPSGRIDP